METINASCAFAAPNNALVNNVNTPIVANFPSTWDLPVGVDGPKATGANQIKAGNILAGIVYAETEFPAGSVFGTVDVNIDLVLAGSWASFPNDGYVSTLSLAQSGSGRGVSLFKGSAGEKQLWVLGSTIDSIVIIDGVTVLEPPGINTLQTFQGAPNNYIVTWNGDIVFNGQFEGLFNPGYFAGLAPRRTLMQNFSYSATYEPPPPPFVPPGFARNERVKLANMSRWLPGQYVPKSRIQKAMPKPQYVTMYGHDPKRNRLK